MPSSELDKISTVKSIIGKDIPGCDMRLSLFVSSAITYRYDSCCTPFPPVFKNDGNEKDINRLMLAIDGIPELPEILTTNDDDLLQILSPDALNLLHWLFVEARGPEVKQVSKKDFTEILSKAPQETPIKTPTHIFQITHRENSGPEISFQQHAKQFNTSFAFHGTKLFYLHNILHQGLQQHLSKNALFGDGLYLSSELNVSLPYSRNGLGWQKSVIGDNMSCVALCEFVEHPIFSKHCLNKDSQKRTELPEKYIIVSNNDCVRVRYLIVYATKTSQHSRNKLKVTGHAEQRQNWTSWINFRTLSVVYLMVLVFVGMSDSPYLNYLKKNLLRKVKSSFRVLLGRE